MNDNNNPTSNNPAPVANNPVDPPATPAPQAPIPTWPLPQTDTSSVQPSISPTTNIPNWANPSTTPEPSMPTATPDLGAASIATPALSSFPAVAAPTLDPTPTPNFAPPAPVAPTPEPAPAQWSSAPTVEPTPPATNSLENSGYNIPSTTLPPEPIAPATPSLDLPPLTPPAPPEANLFATQAPPPTVFTPPTLGTPPLATPEPVVSAPLTGGLDLASLTPPADSVLNLNQPEAPGASTISQMASANPSPSVYMPSVAGVESIGIPPTQTPAMPPSLTNSAAASKPKIPKLALIGLVVISIVLILAVAGYFLLGNKGSSALDSSSLPIDQSPLTNPPKPIKTPIPDASTEATSSSSFGQVNESTSSGSSALDLLRSRTATSSSTR